MSLRSECGTELLLEDLSLLSVFAPLALILALLAVVLFGVALGHVILELNLTVIMCRLRDCMSAPQ